MISLVKNELYKIVKNKFMYISLLLIILICVGSACIIFFLSDNEYNNNSDNNWQEIMKGKIQECNMQLENQENYLYADEIKKNLLEYDYRLKNNIPPSDWRKFAILDYIDLKEFNDYSNISKLNWLESIIKNDDWITYYQFQDEEKKEEMNTYSENTYGYDSISVELEINQLRYDYSIRPSFNEADWKNNYLNKYMENKLKLLENKYALTFIEDNEVQSLQDQNKILLYKIKNNIKDDNIKSMSNYLKKTFSLTIIVLIIGVIYSCLIITSEYTYGTIKNLFCYPFKRYKFYVAKIISVIILEFILINYMYIISIIIGACFFGLDCNPALFITNDNLHVINQYVFFIIKYNISIIKIISYMSITMFLSILIRNSGIVIGSVTSLAILSETLLRHLGSTYYMPLLKFFPLCSFDFNQFLGEKVIVSGLTLPMALINTIIYVLLFICISIKLIKNQDI